MPHERQGKLSISDRAAIRAALASGVRQVDLSTTYGVSRALISRMARQNRVLQPFQARPSHPQQPDRDLYITHRFVEARHAAQSRRFHVVTKGHAGSR